MICCCFCTLIALVHIPAEHSSAQYVHSLDEDEDGTRENARGVEPSLRTADYAEEIPRMDVSSTSSTPRPNPSFTSRSEGSSPSAPSSGGEQSFDGSEMTGSDDSNF